METNANHPRQMSEQQARAIYGLSVSAFPGFSKWEQDFIQSLAKMRADRKALSPKQAACLGRLILKARPWREAMRKKELQNAARYEWRKRERWYEARRRERAG